MNYLIELISFALATVMFLYAGLAPVFEGRPVNVLFLALTVPSVILFVVFLRKATRESGPPGN